MEFLDVTGDADATYTSLDSEAYVAPAPKKRKVINKSEEQDAKMELWKSLAGSLKSKQSQENNVRADNSLSERADLFGKIVADSVLQYDPKELCYLKDY